MMMVYLLFLEIAVAAAQAAPDVTAAPLLADRHVAQTSAVNEISVLWSDALSLLGHLFPPATVASTTTTSARTTSSGHGSRPTAHSLSTTSRLTTASSKEVASQGTPLRHTVSSQSSSTTSTFTTSTTRSIPPPSTTSRSSTEFPAAHAAAASSTSPPTATAVASTSSNPNQAAMIVLAILCTIFGLIALGGLLWYLYQAYRRRKASASEYESDSEVGDYGPVVNEPQMAEDLQHRYDDKSIPPLPPDAHRYSRYDVSPVSPSSDSGNPFGTPAPSIAPMQRPEPMLATAAAAVPVGYQESAARWSTGPSNGPWTPPSPNRPRNVNPPRRYSDIHQARSFDFGFGAEESAQTAFLQSRRSAPRLSTGNSTHSPVAPVSPLSVEPWSAGSGDSMSEVSLRPSRYQDTLYHINEANGP